jgi:3-oxoisoapionate kinase
VTTVSGGPVYGWFGDDFTGATDTLETVVEGGLRAQLFLDVPTEAQLAAVGPLDAIGIAGATRAMAPEAMTPILDRAGRFFAGAGVHLLHYKCCSTFDSAPHVGSLGAAVRALRPHASPLPVPVIGGQPNLGRYCLFGTLFAAAGRGGPVHRIDRHPTMSVHPVTPMLEADLTRHVALQGLSPMATIAYPELSDIEAAWQQVLADAPEAVLVDVAREEDLAPIGRLFATLMIGGKPLLTVGASSVARAFLTIPRDAARAASPDVPAPTARGAHVLALVGSLSPLTRAQVETAGGAYRRLTVDPLRLAADAAYREAVTSAAADSLAGSDTLLLTERPAGTADTQAAALATAHLLRDILARQPVRRVIIGGGDTSSRALQALDAWCLGYVRPFVPGAPLVSLRSDQPHLDRLEIILKGGQMGPPDSFLQALA